MEMFKVESSHIESIGWENDTLFVKYQSGKTYSYEKVKRSVFLEMLGAKSRGQFLNTNIKGKYNFREVK